MAQSSTRGICAVPAVCVGVHAGVTVLWTLAHPATEAMTTADARLNRQEQNRLVLLISCILCLKSWTRSTPQFPPGGRVEQRHFTRIRQEARIEMLRARYYCVTAP